ncbi:MAG: homocysteine S-methyltransferase family protein [Chloroflexota bacterium]
MTRYEKIMQKLKENGRILIDGATGTEVERRGVPPVENAWNGGGALTHPDILRQIHEDYIDLGAQIVISNTFATSKYVLEEAGWDAHFDVLNRKGVTLAIEARDNKNKPDVLVAAGLAHWAWTTDPPLHKLRSDTEEQVAIMAEAGADLFMLEMMHMLDRTLILIEAAQETGLPVWVGFSVRNHEDGIVRLLSGEPLADALAAIQDKNIPLVSIMHSQVEYIDAALAVVKENWAGNVGVYAHSGAHIDDRWRYEDVISPAEYAQECEKWLEQGVQMIGGCCGIGTNHIAELAKIQL